MLVGAFALELLIMKRLEGIECPFIGGRPDGLHAKPKNANDFRWVACSVAQVGFQTIKRGISEPHLHYKSMVYQNFDVVKSDITLSVMY